MTIGGTIISQNVFANEAIDVAFNTPGTVWVSLNNFSLPAGINNLGSGNVAAAENFWGCSGGPGVAGCATSTGTVTFSPSLASAFVNTQLPAAPNSTPVTPPPGTPAITISVTGPNGTTSSTNSFQTTSNQFTLSALKSTSTNPGALTYAWSLSPGYPTASIIGGNTATPSFQVTSPGIYQFTLKVTDATGATATATITVQYV